MTSSENMRSTILESSNTGNAGTQQISLAFVFLSFFRANRSKKSLSFSITLYLDNL